MLWVLYPSSETLAADSCNLFHPQPDAGSFKCSLDGIPLGSVKQRKSCGRQRGQTWDSTTCCLKLYRHTNHSSLSLVTCKSLRCVDARASWRSSVVVLEPLPRLSGRTLEAQLAEIRFPNSSDEDLSSRLVSKDLLDCFNSNWEEDEVEESDAEIEEQRRNAGFEGREFEARRRLECPATGDYSRQLRVKRTSIRSPARTLTSPVARKRVNETILYLESIGVDCRRVFSKEPRVAACNVHRVRSLVHALEFYGLKRKELGRIISMCPKIVHLTAEKDLKPVVDFLQGEIGFPRKDISKLILKCPRLLAYSVDEQLRPTSLFLRTLGFSRIGGVVSKNPTLLALSVDKCLTPKLEYLQSLGLSYKEAVSMVVRFPAIFNYSVKENLQCKYDYLVNEIGGNLMDLMAFPQYFGYSLEKRIKPRHQHVIKHKTRLSLPMMLKLSEGEFMSRLERSRSEQPVNSTSPTEKVNLVDFNGTPLNTCILPDLRESGTPVLMGARTS